jgi:hypothetical protein
MILRSGVLGRVTLSVFETIALRPSSKFVMSQIAN